MSHLQVAIRPTTNRTWTTLGPDVTQVWLEPDVKDVSFTWEVNGGCTEAAFTIIGLEFEDAMNAGVAVRISSVTSGEILWSGQVAFADRDTLSDTEAPNLRVTCEGSAALLSDREYKLPYIVTRQDAWDMSWLDDSVFNSKVESGTHPQSGDIPALNLSIDTGMTINSGQQVQAMFTGYDRTLDFFDRFWFGSFHGRVDNSATDTNFRNNVFVGSATDWRAQTLSNTTAQNMDVTARSDDLTDVLLLDDSRDGGNVTLTKGRWTAWYNMRVYTLMYRRDGARWAPSPTASLDPIDIVEDLIYRVLTGTMIVSRDPARSPRYTDYGTVGRYPIWTFDYSDPATVATVLNDLCLMNPEFYWMLGPADITDGLHGLEWTDWGKTPRYAISRDDVDWADQGDDALYNRITVRYKDDRGRDAAVIKNVSYNDYPDLEDLVLPSGVLRVREAPTVTLPNATSTRANAERVATVILDALARRPYGGTVTISEPLVDSETGRETTPAALRPGVLAQVEDTPELLRVTKVVVDGTTGAATLSLSSPRLTIEALLAKATSRKRK